MIAWAALAGVVGCASPGVQKDQPVQFVGVTLDRPIWLLGLNDPSWLFDFRKDSAGAKIALVPLADEASNFKVAEEQRENSVGRMTRALPLFIAERIFLETNCRVTTNILLVRGVGPVVAGKRSSIDALLQSPRDQKPDVIIQGAIVRAETESKRLVQVDLWDAIQERIEINSGYVSDAATLGSGAGDLAKEIIDHLVTSGRCKRVNPPLSWDSPSRDLIDAYVAALGQLLIQSLAENKFANAESIWGEPDMLAWYEHLGALMPNSTPVRLIRIRGVLMSRRYGGQGWKAAADPVVNDMARTPGGTDDIYRLSPLVLSRLGREDECRARKADLATSREPAYTAWLGRIVCHVPE